MTKRVLIAPDSFGDTLTAVAAAEAIGRGWAVARPDDLLDLAPQSDGGPGFVDVLAARFGKLRRLPVSGPLGARVVATWLLDERGEQVSAYVECAQACGLHQLGGAPSERTALAASTYGVGEIVAAALDAGARRLVVGLGGSASTDGGRGFIDALGGPAAAADRCADIDIVVASDVENPLLGEFGAAAVFGPQKGADPATVTELEQRLSGWADTLARLGGRDIREEVGAGAAGGLGAALLALGGRRVAGATVVAEATNQAAAIERADVVVTGEGKFDSQTLSGKVVAALTGAAAASGARTLVLAGQVTLDADDIAAAGISGAYAIVDFCGSVEQAMADADNQLSGLATQVASAWAD